MKKLFIIGCLLIMAGLFGCDIMQQEVKIYPDKEDMEQADSGDTTDVPQE